MRQAAITGTGMFVPSRVVTNRELETLMDTSDEWIVQRTGIRERRYADEHETPAGIAKEACQQALASAKLEAKDIDFLIVATLSPQHFFPGTAFFVQRELDMGNTPAIDLRCQCSGFIYALSVARAYIKSGEYRRILVCGVELQSRALNKSTEGRDVAVLFGDGAGAVVVEATDNPEEGILNTIVHSDGQYAEKLWVEYPSLARVPHLAPEHVEQGLVYPTMDGRTVFKHAVSKLPEVVMQALSQYNLTVPDIDLFFFHQANLRINEFVGNQLGIQASKIFNNIERYGNCSAASIPMCMAEADTNGLLKPGSLICLAGFGSGFTWGASLIRWKS